MSTLTFADTHNMVAFLEKPAESDGFHEIIDFLNVTQEETQQDDSVPTPSSDPPLSGEDSMQLSELMILCTNLQTQVLDLEKAKDAQAKEIADLKKRLMIPMGEEREVDTSVKDSAAPTTIKEITLARTLIQIKAAKPKVVNTAGLVRMTTTTRPKLEGLVQEPSCDIKTRTGKFTRPSMIKYKGKVQSWIERQSEFLEEEKDGASKRLNGNLECGRNNNLGFGRRRQCVRVKGTRSEKGRKGQRVLMMVRGIAEGLAKRGKDKEVLEERRECLMRETERMAGVSTVADMEFESANSGTTAKLPKLKLENGNSWLFVPQTAQENGTSVIKMFVPVTAEEKMIRLILLGVDFDFVEVDFSVDFLTLTVSSSSFCSRARSRRIHCSKNVFVLIEVSLWMVTGERQAARIRNLYLKTILRQDISFFDKERNTGEVVGRMSGDTVPIQDAMGEKFLSISSKTKANAQIGTFSDVAAIQVGEALAIGRTNIVPGDVAATAQSVALDKLISHEKMIEPVPTDSRDNFNKRIVVFVFGDSFFDPGNNNYIKTTASYQVNYWPYGESYFNPPTGRFSNGRLIPDFIAEYVRLPLIPPYLEPGNNGFKYRANFASAGSDALIDTRVKLVSRMGRQHVVEVVLFEGTTAVEGKEEERRDSVVDTPYNLQSLFKGYGTITQLSKFFVTELFKLGQFLLWNNRDNIPLA
ncbi:SGNH hydrolase-type esterase domain-containing protein, partial [Tanacetum coccineum]